MYVVPDKELQVLKYASAYSENKEKMNFMTCFSAKYIYSFPFSRLETVSLSVKNCLFANTTLSLRYRPRAANLNDSMAVLPFTTNKKYKYSIITLLYKESKYLN